MDTSTRKTIFNLSLFDRQEKSFKTKDQIYFLRTLAELQDEGFSMQQSLNFQKLLMKNHQNILGDIINSLASGNSFEKSIQPYGFSNQIIAQIFYGQRQGNFTKTLKAISQQLEKIEKYKNQLVKTLIYPLFMSVFLLALLIGMRSFLLPHIASFISQELYDEQFLVRLLVGFFSYLPQILLFTLAILLFIYLFIDFYLMRQTYIKRYKILVKIPLIRKWTRQYVSYLLSRELGHFFASGYSIQQIIKLLIDYPINPFLTELAQVMNDSLSQGLDMVDIIEDLEIFTQELPLVIHQGELTSQTAHKCSHYSQRILSQLMEDLGRKLNYVQPIIFIIIAVLIMAMYLLMMLPMLSMDVGTL